MPTDGQAIGRFAAYVRGLEAAGSKTKVTAERRGTLDTIVFDADAADAPPLNSKVVVEITYSTAAE